MNSFTVQESAEQPTESDHVIIRKLFRRLISFLFILFVFSFLDRINIGFAGLTMGKDLGLSATMFGLAATLFYITYSTFGIPSNVMLGIVGARRWIATIMVCWGVASTLTMFATGPLSLYALRMIVGVAEAGFFPGIMLYLTYWFPAYYRARANALFMVAMPITMMLGSILSGYILALDGVMNLKGWQWLFLLEGLPAVVLGVVTWHFLDDGPQQANWLTATEKVRLGEMLAAEQDRGVATAQRLGLRSVFTPVVVLYALAYFCLTNTLSAINIWTPQILQNLNQGSSNQTIGLLAAIPQFCTVLAMVGWSLRSDRYRERKFHTWFPFAVAAAGWLVTIISAQPFWQLTGIILASAGSFTAMAIFWTTPDHVIAAPSRALAIALICAIGNLGSAFSPVLLGVLHDMTGSFSAGIGVMGILLLVGAAVITVIPMTETPLPKGNASDSVFRPR
ncbi:4-hydroxyphenylacetate permease [Serratia grimesii]|uniref:4-hydroxyphenylacetate permease n=1 Tax=Serratia grimesii TaxID=82995 RepID=UPI00077CD557|nr:4-hydroxyphenylacetate permease [Serratia grimesii]CAI1169362.1 Inner membrane transport protein RhmT [Serratia grimesii]CAI2433360.1 Inner membrane transport protein RhmT [Serratia grimesii]SUI33617.1 Inner membrane transport protein RhmT [Serratia grimesii]